MAVFSGCAAACGRIIDVAASAPIKCIHTNIRVCYRFFAFALQLLTIGAYVCCSFGQ